MIIFSDGAEADLEKIFEFNAERDPASASEHVEIIRSAISILKAHPEIGRRTHVRSTMRELIISTGTTGYVALYEYFPMDDLVVVHAVRHRRETGYLRE